MALELKIVSPSPEGFVQEIIWNADEIAEEVAAKVGYYKNLVYTEDQVTEAKKDRAKLRKFRDEHRREIVHAEKAQVFQITVGLCFSSARHPRHNHKSIISLLHADTSETYARIQNLRNHNR